MKIIVCLYIRMVSVPTEHLGAWVLALTAIQNVLGSKLPLANITQGTLGQLEITQDALGISKRIQFLCQSC